MNVRHQAVSPERDNRDRPLIYTRVRPVHRHQRMGSHAVSPWSQSFAKRIFDVALVLASLPLLLPLIAIIAFAVRLTSRGPVLFLQKRIGRDAEPFTIIKFRTMIHSDVLVNGSITTINNQHITSVGRFLRQWKLDELPQLFNVLRADMSLVGPRPKIPEQQIGYLTCRPGVTGAASFAFAREEVLLAQVPKQQLHTYYRDVVLPLKQQLDDAYMARATFMSDLELILKTLLRLWDSKAVEFSGNRLPMAPGRASRDRIDLPTSENGKHDAVSRSDMPGCSNGAHGL